MIVDIVAYTQINWAGDPWLKNSGYIPQFDYALDNNIDPFEAIAARPSDRIGDRLIPTYADELAEVGGRLCYKSFNRPNPKTASNRGYLANIIAQQHFSVLEHASVTFYVAGVSRTLLTELERHRHLSLSVFSQRYGDESEANFIVPPDLEKYLHEYFSEDDRNDPFAPKIWETLEGMMSDLQRLYSGLFDFLISKGLSKKQARSAARSVLPNGTETAMLVTGNHRTWREIIAKRSSPGADTEIQIFAKKILGQVKRIAPNTYQDFEEEQS